MDNRWRRNHNKSLEDIFSDIKDDVENNQYDLDDVEYYLYDRNEWIKKLIQRDGLDQQDYDTDIHTIGELIYQLWRLKKIIYEDENGKVFNWSKKLQKNLSHKGERVLKENVDTQFDEELGLIGTIFLKYSYDTLPIDKRLENLKQFRMMVRDSLMDKGIDTMDYPSIKQDKLKRELDDIDTTDMKIDRLDKFVDETNFDIENYLNKIGFTKFQMVDFFKDLLEYND